MTVELTPDISISAIELEKLTEQQKANFVEFKRILADENLLVEGSPPSASDPVAAIGDKEFELLRFLRARRYDPQAALKQFASHVKWRQQHDLDNLYTNFDSGPFEDSKRFYPQFIGRTDKAGRPVYVYRLAALTSDRMKELNAFTPEKRFQRQVVLYEYMTRMMLPACARLPTRDTEVNMATTSIIDLKDVSIKLAWAIRSHLQTASVMANSNYPETLGSIIVVNAPSFFPTVWGWVKGWFDEVTQKKVQILSQSNQTDIGNYIDLKDVPKEYGGELEWTYDDPPNLDEKMKELFKANGGKYPQGPWVYFNGQLRKASELDAAELAKTAQELAKVLVEEPKAE